MATALLSVSAGDGAVRIASLNPKLNGSHFGLPPSRIHRMTGWVAVYHDVCARPPLSTVRVEHFESLSKISQNWLAMQQSVFEAVSFEVGT